MTKYLDKDGLVLYDQKIKAIIKKAQTAADNAQSSANTANTPLRHRLRVRHRRQALRHRRHRQQPTKPYQRVEAT